MKMCSCAGADQDAFRNLLVGHAGQSRSQIDTVSDHRQISGPRAKMTQINRSGGDPPPHLEFIDVGIPVGQVLNNLTKDTALPQSGPAGPQG